MKCVLKHRRTLKDLRWLKHLHCGHQQNECLRARQTSLATNYVNEFCGLAKSGHDQPRLGSNISGFASTCPGGLFVINVCLALDTFQRGRRVEGSKQDNNWIAYTMLSGSEPSASATCHLLLAACCLLLAALQNLLKCEMRSTQVKWKMKADVVVITIDNYCCCYRCCWCFRCYRCAFVPDCKYRKFNCAALSV